MKTHCRNGHRYTQANTAITPSGHRRCRTCKREWARTSRKAKYPQNAVKVECIRQHPFDTENTYVTTRGHRACRACKRDRDNRRTRRRPQPKRRTPR